MSAVLHTRVTGQLMRLRLRDDDSDSIGQLGATGRYVVYSGQACGKMKGQARLRERAKPVLFRHTSKRYTALDCVAMWPTPRWTTDLPHRPRSPTGHVGLRDRPRWGSETAESQNANLAVKLKNLMAPAAPTA